MPQTAERVHPQAHESVAEPSNAPASGEVHAVAGKKCNKTSGRMVCRRSGRHSRRQQPESTAVCAFKNTLEEDSVIRKVALYCMLRSNAVNVK